jgi:hypothetical protein
MKAKKPRPASNRRRDGARHACAVFADEVIAFIRGSRAFLLLRSSTGRDPHIAGDFPFVRPQVPLPQFLHIRGTMRDVDPGRTAAVAAPPKGSGMMPRNAMSPIWTRNWTVLEAPAPSRTRKTRLLFFRDSGYSAAAMV